MRAVEVAEDRLLRVVDRPWPEPGSGQVAIDVAFCGICGSDLHFREVPALFPAGTVPGHEMSGSIGVLGAGVTDWSEGDRVCVLPFAQCGECAACRAGTEHVCGTAIANAPLGRVVMVGIAPEPFALDPLPVVFKEVDIRGSFIYRRADFQEAIDLLAGGRIPSAELINDRVGFDRAEETFQALLAPGNRRVKVLLDPKLVA